MDLDTIQYGLTCILLFWLTVGVNGSAAVLNAENEQCATQWAVVAVFSFTRCYFGLKKH